MRNLLMDANIAFLLFKRCLHKTICVYMGLKLEK